MSDDLNILQHMGFTLTTRLVDGLGLSRLTGGIFRQCVGVVWIALVWACLLSGMLGYGCGLFCCLLKIVQGCSALWLVVCFHTLRLVSI